MTIDPAIEAFADDFAREDEVLLAARDTADDLGVEPLTPGTGAALTVLAMAAHPKTIVEIGTGVGVSGIYLLRGMHPAGVLTTIDVEPEHHKAARASFMAAGFAPERVRLITGRALDVLPRLTDGGYDLVLIDGKRTEFPAYLDEARRLVRPGGMIVVAHALARGKVADPAQRDQETTAVREALRSVRRAEDERASLIPIGDGLLVVIVGA